MIRGLNYRPRRIHSRTIEAYPYDYIYERIPSNLEESIVPNATKHGVRCSRIPRNFELRKMELQKGNFSEIIYRWCKRT